MPAGPAAGESATRRSRTLQNAPAEGVRDRTTDHDDFGVEQLNRR